MTLDLTKLWSTYPVLSVDFETTSPDPLTCEPVEVAVVRFESGAIVARYSTLLRTREPIPAESTAIHGITDEMVAGAPTLEEVSHELVKLSEGAVPLAFNREFDRTIMHRYLSGEGVTLFDPAQPWLCSLSMAWSADGGKGRHKLRECCERRGIRIVGAHRAEGDAIAGGTLFFQIMGLAEKATMAQLLARVANVEAEREREFAERRRYAREKDRVLWHDYAKAAIEGACRSEFRRDVTLLADLAEGVANEMLERERKRWA